MGCPEPPAEGLKPEKMRALCPKGGADGGDGARSVEHQSVRDSAALSGVDCASNIDPPIFLGVAFKDMLEDCVAFGLVDLRRIGAW